MQSTLSELFRSIEADIGAHQFCLMALDALKDALKQYRFKSRESFLAHFEEIFELVRTSKPRYAILIDSFYKLKELYKHAPADLPVSRLIDEIDQIKAGYNQEMQTLLKHAQTLPVQGKRVLIYDHSHSVHAALKALKDSGKKFEVLVAEQDLEKTADNIHFLHDAGIPYKVIPAYMLSQIDASVDLLLFGALTLQSNGQFVMDPGSKSILSHFHLEKKPSYLLITTSKFSLWKIEKEHETHTVSHKRKHKAKDAIEYERIKFSHDRVPVELFTHIITEKGMHSPQEANGMFETLMQARLL